jgi:hypothetical protein
MKKTITRILGAYELTSWKNRTVQNDYVVPNSGNMLLAKCTTYELTPRIAVRFLTILGTLDPKNKEFHQKKLSEQRGQEWDTIGYGVKTRLIGGRTLRKYGTDGTYRDHQPTKSYQYSSVYA